jgi:vancomycin permeability regulator SanA
MKTFYRVLLSLGILLLTSVLFAYLINRHVYHLATPKRTDTITNIAVTEPPPIAIVFGAGVWNGNEPSPILYDRVVTAVELFRAGRVRKLLMSGDNPNKSYDEPTVMKETAMKLGVPEENIVLDYAGRRTYDTCMRAREIFEVKKAILVTQDFHLNRSLYLCNALGVDSVGIQSDRRKYDMANRLAWRETLSNISAWFELNFYPWKPILGKKEPIEP